MVAMFRRNGENTKSENGQMRGQKIQREKMGKIKVHIVNYHKNHRSLIADEASRGC